MLFIRFDYMIHQWTILRQEKASSLQRLPVPHFWGPYFKVLLWTLFLLHFCRLEPYFRANTEVSNNIKNNLLQHRVFRQLLENIWLRIELIWVHWSKIHDVTNIQIVNPVVMVFHAERVTHINLEPLVRFELVYCTPTWEAWFLLMLS